ncbi:MAG: T9SS type A sorting domain-containing protein, partial [bacterium]|nr:T9SS type A sorting domain-containing protein [bacterium]
FDNDGWLDVFFIYNPCKLYRNNGDGTFDDVTSAMGLSGATADWSGVAFDYDNDGYQDLYLLHDPVCQLWHNDSGAGFTNVTNAMGCGNDGSNPEGVDVGDFNNDGWLDIYIANISEQPYYPDDNRLYRNDSGTGFTDVTNSAGVANIGDGRATWFLDYDNDGLTDLFCTNHVNDNAMYHNNGDDTFTDVAGSLGIRNPWDSFGVSWCDYDYDGDLDVYMAGHFDNRLMRNDECPGNFIIFHMEGTDSNRAAIGAKVKVTAGGFDRYDAVVGGSGKNGQDSLPLEFGLGTEVVADTVQIRWPSGLVEEYYDLDANHHYYAIEGDGIEVGIEEDNNEPIPTVFALNPVYPNPSDGSVIFDFVLPIAMNVRLEVFDIKGRKVSSVLDEARPAGANKVTANLALSSGVYLYRLSADEYSAAKKFVVQ